MLVCFTVVRSPTSNRPSAEQASRRRIYLAALLLAIGVGCGQSKPIVRPIRAGEKPATAISTKVATKDARVEWLEEHAIRFRSIDPADDDYSDLEPLRAALQGVRIVALGEQSHRDGATFRAKTRLVGFLHEELGFDVIAFESGLYACAVADDELRKGAEPREAAGLCVYRIWSGVAETEGLWSRLSPEEGKRRLELAGFDCRLNGKRHGAHLLNRLRARLAEVDREFGDAPLWSALAWAFEHADDMDLPPKADRDRALAALFLVRARLDLAVRATAERNEELELLHQVLDSTIGLARFRWREDRPLHAYDLLRGLNGRDRQMAENLLWLANQRYPGRKIIVWAATMHIARNIESIAQLDPTIPEYHAAGTMGQYVKAALGDEFLSVGFLAHDGSAGTTKSPIPLGVPPADSLEGLLVQAGIDNGFVDLRNARAGSFPSAQTVARPLGYRPHRADWSRLLDAVVFTKTMFPVTTLK